MINPLNFSTEITSAHPYPNSAYMSPNKTHTKSKEPSRKYIGQFTASCASESFKLAMSRTSHVHYITKERQSPFSTLIRCLRSKSPATSRTYKHVLQASALNTSQPENIDLHIGMPLKSKPNNQPRPHKWLLSAMQTN